MISDGFPRVPSYHSLPTTLGGARARTLQRQTPLQAPPLAVIRLRAVFTSELSQQAPIPKDNPPILLCLQAPSSRAWA